MNLGAGVTTEQKPFSLLRAPRPIDIVQLQTTSSIVFTARADADFQIESLIAANVTAGAAYVTVYLVPSGGSPGASNMVVFQRAIAAKDWLVLYDRESMAFLQPGATLRALCGVNNDVNIYGYGYDYQGQYST